MIPKPERVLTMTVRNDRKVRCDRNCKRAPFIYLKLHTVDQMYDIQQEHADYA